MLSPELHWSLQADYPHLALIQLFPLMIAFSIWANQHSHSLSRFATVGSIAQCVLIGLTWNSFQSETPAYQFAEYHGIGPWSYHVAVSFTNLFWVSVTTVLTVLVILLGRRFQPEDNYGKTLSRVFIAQFGLIMMIASFNLIWAYVGLTLAALALLSIAKQWQVRIVELHFTRIYITVSVALTALGIILLAKGILYYQHSGRWSFDLIDLMN